VSRTFSACIRWHRTFLQGISDVPSFTGHFRQHASVVAHDLLHTGGLYAGFLPNLVRNTIISSSELVTYDVTKRHLAGSGMPDGPLLHMMSGLTAGLVATALGSPMDVVSTRIMVNKQQGYNLGMGDTCKQMIVNEGFSSFYQGFMPNFLRIGSFNVVMWMAYEQIASHFL
jgi:solute carrier family 25 (mitochondrial uncoupling protein), member 8/9